MLWSIMLSFEIYEYLNMFIQMHWLEKAKPFQLVSIPVNYENYCQRAEKLVLQFAEWSVDCLVVLFIISFKLMVGQLWPVSLGLCRQKVIQIVSNVIRAWVTVFLATWYVVIHGTWFKLNSSAFAKMLLYFGSKQVSLYEATTFLQDEWIMMLK